MDNLKDILRSSIGDPSSIPVIQYEGKYYVQEFSIEQFMMDNRILSEETVIQDICESNNILNIDIIDESQNNDFINSIFELCNLLEAIDAKEVMDVADGGIKNQMLKDQICAFIMMREYDKKSELKAGIEKCDRLIKDIDEELKVADDRAKNSQYKFMARFLFSILKKLFMGFIYPLFVKKTITAPGKLKDILGLATKKYHEIVPTQLDKAIYIGGIIFDITPDAVNAAKGAVNYKKLLIDYKSSIEGVKAELETQLKALEKEK